MALKSGVILNAAKRRIHATPGVEVTCFMPPPTYRCTQNHCLDAPFARYVTCRIRRRAHPLPDVPKTNPDTLRGVEYEAIRRYRCVDGHPGRRYIFRVCPDAGSLASPGSKEDRLPRGHLEAGRRVKA